MAINFEAANMAGYNNPKIVVLNAEVSAPSTVTSAPKLSDINNIFKSGFIPVISARDQTAGGSFVLWPAGITDGGDYEFSNIFISPQTVAPMMAVLLFSTATNEASFHSVPLQVGTP